MIGEHRWTGVGAGAFVTAYPQYESYHDGKVVDHAHNDYLELVAETGVLGGLGGLAFVFLLFRDARRRLQESAGGFVQAVRLGAAVGCAGLLLHGLVDFNLQLPANALLFLLLAHLATLAPAARHADS
jgi:O-antigen ligase